MDSGVEIIVCRFGFVMESGSMRGTLFRHMCNFGTRRGEGGSTGMSEHWEQAAKTNDREGAQRYVRRVEADSVRQRFKMCAHRQRFRCVGAVVTIFIKLRAPTTALGRSINCETTSPSLTP